MATSIKTRLAKIEAQVVSPNECDPGLIGMHKWYCGITGNPFRLENVPRGITLSEVIKRCSGRSLPIIVDDVLADEGGQ
jgi:hypothetical protein